MCYREFPLGWVKVWKEE
ncbi:MAG: hypothetical protein IPF81_17690 [Bacteroidetes bacterium]|nr:hypothetical protein [Bacteroidota bacterium]